MCDQRCMNQKKCLKLVFCLCPSCSHFGKKGEEISSSIPTTKQAKEEGGDIVAKNVGRPSLSPLEQRTYRL
jgi:hypothetical protein